MTFVRRLLEIETKWTIAGTLFGLLVMLAGGLTTERHFAQVKYPGADFGGVPLTFDLVKKNTNLETLKEIGTYDLFVFVQYLDFGIVLGTLLFFTFLGLLMLKLIPKKTLTYSTGVAAVLCYLIAPLMDALENISLLSYLDVREYATVEWINAMNSVFTLGKISFFYLGWIASLIVLLNIVLNGRRWISNS